MDSLHHLLRVRMRSTRFERLKEIAEIESQKGSYVSVSDIVRIAIDNWLQSYESAERMKRAFSKKETK
jgi:Arc/MetJ-type ribon-helix-helix transcriptional regulator